jgi:hypothetical protein
MLANFKKRFNAKIAFLLFVIAGFVGIGYHALVITRVVDYANAWGGRLPSVEAMYVFESVSVVMQVVFLTIATLKHRYVGGKKTQKVLSVLLFGLSGLLLLNTVGNTFSTSTFEAVMFTPLTLVMSVVAFRLALE